LNKISWIIFTVITIGIISALVIFSGGKKVDISKVDPNAVQTANSQNGNIADHVFGKVGSKVTLIEYGDFQCPPCASAHPVVKSITNQYKDQLQFVFRNFPITEAHPNAKAASGTAEAAGLQGKYWEMNDKIYSTQTDWSDLSITERSKFFENLANELGLDIKKFNADLQATAINEKINFDLGLGKKAGVEATPTFYLDGKKLDTAAYGTEVKFKESINAELEKAGIPLPQ
jgi:protein-disulfide isomerase